MMCDSELVFAKALANAGLESLTDKMKAKGWVTYNTFAFACSSFGQPAPEIFAKDIIVPLIGEHGADDPLVPRLRQVFFQAFTFAAAELSAMTDPNKAERPVLLRVEREAGLTRVRKALEDNFGVALHNEPSTKLINRCFGLLGSDQTGAAVQWVPWERCTSMEQQIDGQPEEDPGLRIQTDGSLASQSASLPNCALSSDYKWNAAMRRRGVALDVAGVMQYKLHSLWIERMCMHMDLEPPANHVKVTWQQVQDADKALWRYAASNCNRSGGAGMLPGETITRFQKFWAEGTTNGQVTQHLNFVQGSVVRGNQGGRGSSQDYLMLDNGGDSKAKRQLEGTEAELAATKKKVNQLENEVKRTRRAGGGSNGRGGGRDGGPPPPPVTMDLPPNRRKTTDNNKRFCFLFNSDRGCPDADAGGECKRGCHVCIMCKPDAPHSCIIHNVNGAYKRS